MTTIYLIRHAEAEGNLYRRAHGQYDSLITENGYNQIRALSQRFRGVEIDEVWSSDLFRTMTTARAILEPLGKSLNTHQGLREINMGVWEDKTWGQLTREFPEGMTQFSTSSCDWCPDHGETFEKLTERISKTMTELARQNEGKTVAIFCHGLAIRQFMAYVNQVPQEEWASSPHGDNTSVSKLLWDGEKFTVELSGDNSHLNDDISTFARQKWWREGEDGVQKDLNLWFHEAETIEEKKEYQGAVLDVWGVDAPRVLTTVFQGMDGEDVAGWVSVSEAGEIVLLHLKEGYRGDRQGLQLLGQAVSYARGKGITVLYCSCPPDLDLGFMTKFGFEKKDDRYEFYMGHKPRENILK